MATVTLALPTLSPRASAWSLLHPDGEADGDDVLTAAVAPDNDAVAPSPSGHVNYNYIILMLSKMITQCESNHTKLTSTQ